MCYRLIHEPLCLKLLLFFELLSFIWTFETNLAIDYLISEFWIILVTSSLNELNERTQLNYYGTERRRKLKSLIWLIARQVYIFMYDKPDSWQKSIMPTLTAVSQLSLWTAFRNSMPFCCLDNKVYVYIIWISMK